MKNLLKLIKSTLIGLSLAGIVSGFTPSPTPAEEIVINSIKENKKIEYSTSNKNQKKNKPTFFGFGTYNLGTVTYLPCEPLEGPYQPGGAHIVPSQPYDLAYSFGIGMDYKLLPSFALFIDGGFSSWKKLIAEKNGYSAGAWIWEQSGYEDARIGPFPMDTYYYMDATSLRAGARYIPSKGKIEPWIGVGYGVYAWQATIGNRKEEKKYGQNSGLVGGLTFLGGVDLNFKDFIFRIFGEAASPVANPKIENLFQKGWTFENTGGEHILGPYRFGIGIGVK